MNKYKKRILMFPLLFSPLLITPLVATSCTYLDELCERMHVNLLNISDDISLTKNDKGIDEYLFVNETKILNNKYFTDYYSSAPSKPGLAEYANKILKILNVGSFKLVYGSDSENILFYENENPIDFSDFKINYDIKKMTNDITFYAFDKNGNKRLVESNLFKFEDYAKDIDCKIEVTIERKKNINNKSIISTTLNYIFTLKDSKKNWKWWYTRNPISLKMVSEEQEKVMLIKSGINQKLNVDNTNEIWLITDCYNDFIRGTNANIDTIGKFIQWLGGSSTIDSTANETVTSGLEKLNNNVKKIFKDILKCIKTDIIQNSFKISKDDLTCEYLNLQSDTEPVIYPLKKINLSLKKIERIDNGMKIFFSFRKSDDVNWVGTEQEWLQNVNIDMGIRMVFGESNKGNINFN